MEARKHGRKNKIFTLLAIILVVSFIVRVYGLGRENIWTDEGVTIYNSHKSVYHNIEWSVGFAYFPLYHIISSGWEKISGLSEFSVRFPSVLFGTLSVFLIYEIAALLFNKKIGLYSAAIMALSPFNVYYSQEARVYSFFLLLSLLSIYHYIKYAKSLRTKDLGYYFIYSLLILMSHAAAIFILVFQNIHYFAFVRKNLKRWIFVQFSIFALFLPLLFLILGRVAELSDYLIVPKPGIITLLRTFYIFSAGSTYKLSALIFGSIISLIFGVLLLKSALIIANHIIKKDSQKISDAAFVALWLTMPIIFVVIQSYALDSFYFERYAIASSASLYILISIAANSLKKRAQRIVMAAIVLLSLSLLYIDFMTSDKGEWKDIAKYIRQNKGPKDALILHVPNSIYPFVYYYDFECFKDDNLTKCASEQNIYTAVNSSNLPPGIKSKDKVFLVLYNEKYIDRYGTLLKYFTENYRLREKKELGHIKIFKFSK